VNTRERVEAWIETLRCLGSERTSGDLADELIELIFTATGGDA